MEPLCPDCRSPLEPGAEAWDCRSCGRLYPALRGIPDLRTQDDLYLPNAKDWSYARELDRSFDRLDFRGLLNRYFDLLGETSPKNRSRQIHHILSAPGRANQWVDRLGPSAREGPVLDLGCGSGSFLAARAASLGPAIGLDIAMRWLILARKRLDECGLHHVRLVCGCAEDLPFADSEFAAIVGGDVIEHVNHQADVLSEAHRVLRPGGRFVMASPNRFSLANEPHVGVWGVGFLPRDWMGPYVRLVSNHDFRAIRTLGLGEWHRLLKSSPFSIARIEAPKLPAEDFRHFSAIKRGLGRLYNAIVTRPVGQAFAKRVGPLFHVMVEKDQAPIPAIRPRSTHTATRP